MPSSASSSEPPPQPGSEKRPPAQRPGLVIAYAALLLMLMGGTGIAVIHQQTRRVRAGYRLSVLDAERSKLREQERKLDLKKTREGRLEALTERARALKLRLPGEDEELYELMR